MQRRILLISMGRSLPCRKDFVTLQMNTRTKPINMKHRTKKFLYIGVGVVAVIIAVAIIYDQYHIEPDPKPNPYKEQLDNIDLVMDENGNAHWVEKDKVAENQQNQSQGYSQTEAYQQNEDNGVNHNGNVPAPPKTVVKRVTNPCNFCNNGICRTCIGSPGGYYRNGIFYPCLNCIPGQPGKCRFCQGTGETVLIITFYPDGSSSAIDMNGKVYYNVPGANDLLTDEDQRTLKGEATTTNTEPLDLVIYDTPDYTGEGRKVYCERCRKEDFPHRHKTVH